MFVVRRSAERGHADHGWLKTFHTFSFADYRDSRFMGFRSLRVINEDFIAAGKGFGTHPHHDMEIVTYLLEGKLEHRDSMGYGEVLTPGEFQRITAGTGITHSEFNPSTEQPTHLYQIWLLPERKGIEPSYEQKAFDRQARLSQWQLVASPDGSSGSLTIHQQVLIYLGDLATGEALEYTVDPQRHLWLQVLRGDVTVTNDISVANGSSANTLATGDAVAISDETKLVVRANGPSELMLFDLN